MHSPVSICALCYKLKHLHQTTTYQEVCHEPAQRRRCNGRAPPLSSGRRGANCSRCGYGPGAARLSISTLGAPVHIRLQIWLMAGSCTLRKTAWNLPTRNWRKALEKPCRLAGANGRRPSYVSQPLMPGPVCDRLVAASACCRVYKRQNTHDCTRSVLPPRAGVAGRWSRVAHLPGRWWAGTSDDPRYSTNSLQLERLWHSECQRRSNCKESVEYRGLSDVPAHHRPGRWATRDHRPATPARGGRTDRVQSGVFCLLYTRQQALPPQVYHTGGRGLGVGRRRTVVDR